MYTLSLMPYTLIVETFLEKYFVINNFEASYHIASLYGIFQISLTIAHNFIVSYAIDNVNT